MKCTALAVATLVAAASVASAADYHHPALRALAAPEPDTPSADTAAAGPTESNVHSRLAEAAAGKESINDDSKKPKEWWGGFGWGRPWGGYGGWGGWSGYGGLGGWGGGWGW